MKRKKDVYYIYGKKIGIFIYYVYQTLSRHETL